MAPGGWSAGKALKVRRRTGRRILVIARDPQLRAQLRSLERLPGYRLRWTDGLSAAAALLAGSDRPDVMLLDFGLCTGEDLERCRQLKQALPDVPLVVLSPVASPEGLEAARLAGADRFVPAPFEPLDLVATLDQLLATGP